LNPVLADSETVTVRRGPGIRAPERASAKDPPNIAVSSSKIILMIDTVAAHLRGSGRRGMDL